MVKNLPANAGAFASDTSGKESTCHCRRRKRHGFDPWGRKIPWRKAWQPIPVLLPRESQGQQNLTGYSPQGPEELATTEATEHLSTGL